MPTRRLELSMKSPDLYGDQMVRIRTVEALTRQADL